VTAADHWPAPVTALQLSQPPPTQSVLVASSAVVPAGTVAAAVDSVSHSAAAAVPAAAEAADASFAVAAATVAVAVVAAVSALAVEAVQPTAHSCMPIHSANLTTQQLPVRHPNEAFWPHQTAHSTHNINTHNIRYSTFV